MGLLLLIAVVLLPRLMGMRYFVILSGSMEPAYPVGSLILTEPASRKDISVGDVITYRLDGGLVVTHRVVEIVEEGYRTKGDRNEQADGAIIASSQLLGKPSLMIPLMGYAIHFIQNPPGLYLAAAVVAALLLLSFALDERGRPQSGRYRRVPKENIKKEGKNKS